MTVSILFKKHKAGEISRDKFLYEVRRDELLPFINNLTSYEDSIKMLKNRGIVREAEITENYEVHYSDGIRQAKKFSDLQKAMHFAKNLISTNDKLQHVDIFKAGNNFNSTADTNAVVAWWGDKSYMDNASKKDPALAAKKISLSEATEDGYTDPDDGGQDDQDAMSKNANRQPSKTKIITTAELLDIANKAGQIVIDAERELVQLAVAYGDRISMDAVNAILTNYDMSLEDLDDMEVQSNRDLSIDDLYDRGYMEEIALNEVNANFQIEPILSRILDGLNPYTVKAALNYELEKKPVVGDVEYQKLLMKIAKKLQKDPLAYEYTQFGNAKKVAKEDAKLQMTPIKDKNHTDTPNEMKKVKGHTDAKANTKATKKENKKGHPKGVKIMKESVLKDLTSFLKKKIQLEGINRYDYGVGTQVHTPMGEGAVIEVNGGTVTVQYEDGNKKDYQMNYLNNLRESGLSLDHYKEALEQCNWEVPHPEDIAALTHIYSQLSDDDKANAKKEYEEILVNTKPGNETTDKVDALDAGAEFDGYNVTPKEAPVKEDKKHQILKSLEELLFKKKTTPGSISTVADTKPVSLNPADPADQSVMKDPQFRQKYQSA